MKPQSVPKPTTPDEEIDVLRLRIQESGLSNTAFGKRVVHRDPRTVRRWLSGEHRISKVVVDWLVNPTPHPWPPQPRPKRRKD